MRAGGLLAAALLPFDGVAGQSAVPAGRASADVGHCARGGQDELVICGSRAGESPYRLPPAVRGDGGFDLSGPADSVSRERHRLMDEGGAGALQGACSTTGAMGWAGCDFRKWEAGAQRRGFRPR